MEAENYSIITNRQGQRILVVDDPLTDAQIAALGYDDFDGVLIRQTNLRLLSEMIFDMNPVTTRTFVYKPLFISPVFGGTDFDTKPLVDGCSDDVEDEVLIKIVEFVQQNVREWNIQVLDVEVSRGAYWFLRMIRYLISRGKENLEALALDSASSRGIARPLFEIFQRRGFYHMTEVDQLITEFMAQGFLQRGRFHEKLHLCPVCLHSHLLFLETCPKCGSSNVREDLVIHHFPCANVSPESTYFYDGKLRCPKCNQFLRHIGVDYDRPASVYQCNTCSANFGQPLMQALCTSCGKRNSPDSLTPFEIYDYTFTDAGRRILAVRDVVSHANNDVPFEGLFSFSHFTRFIERRVQLSAEQNREISFFVLRVLVTSPGANAQAEELIASTIYNQFYRHYVTYLNARFMVLSIPISSIGSEKMPSGTELEQDFTRRTEQAIASLQGQLPEGCSLSFDIVRYRTGQHIGDFIRNLDI